MQMRTSDLYTNKEIGQVRDQGLGCHPVHTKIWDFPLIKLGGKLYITCYLYYAFKKSYSSQMHKPLTGLYKNQQEIWNS